MTPSNWNLALSALEMSESAKYLRDHRVAVKFEGDAPARMTMAELQSTAVMWPTKRAESNAAGCVGIVAGIVAFWAGLVWTVGLVFGWWAI